MSVIIFLIHLIIPFCCIEKPSVMQIQDNQRRVLGKLKRLKPRFGVLPTRVQANPKAYKRHPKHKAPREAVQD